MSRTYYLVIDDDCRPSLHPVNPENGMPETPVCPVCPPCPPVTPVPPPIEPFPPVPVPPTEPTPPIIGRVVTNGGNLNVRSEPSMQGEIIARLPHWTRVIILDQSTPGWYRISTNGTQGYVSSQWILLDH